MGFERPALKENLQKCVNLIFGQTYGNRQTMQRIKRHCHVYLSARPWTSNIVLLYAFFWVIPRRLNFICRRFDDCMLLVMDEWMN